MTKNLKETVKNDIIERTKRELITNEILVGYYEQEIKNITNKEDKARTEAKKAQIEQSRDFNKKFLEYAEKI